MRRSVIVGDVGYIGKSRMWREELEAQSPRDIDMHGTCADLRRLSQGNERILL